MGERDGAEGRSAAALGDRIAAGVTRAGGSLTGLAAIAALTAALAVAAMRFELLGVVALAVIVAIAWSVALAFARTPAGRALVRGPFARTLAGTLAPAALVAISVGQLGPFWLGRKQTLLDQDNTTHVERARVFWDAVVHGHWPVWTNLPEGGDSLVDAYGWAGNLLPPLFRALSLGKLSFDRAYVCSVCAMHTFTALAVYALCRRFARRWVAFLVALLFIAGGHLVPAFATDRSFWHLHLFMGLWHSLLGALLAMLSATKLIDVIRRGRRRDAIAAALLATTACLAHGLGGLSTILLGGFVVGAGLLDHPVRARRAWLAAAALAGGVLLAGAWLVPASRMLAEYGLHFPAPPSEGDAYWIEFLGPLSTITLLAATLASFAALGHRDVLLRGLALSGLLTVLASETGVLAQTRLIDISTVSSLQWHRIDVLHQLVSVAPLAVVIDRMVARASPAALAVRRIAARAIFVVFAIVFVVPPVALTVSRGESELLGIVPWRYQNEGAYRQLEDWLVALKQRDPSAFRVHFGAYANGHAVVALALRTKVPITAMHNPPGLFLKNRPQFGDLADVRAWGAKYLVLDGTTAPSPNWKPFGQVSIYRIYRDDGFLGMARATAGAHAEVTKFTDEEIRVRVTGAPPGGADVQLAVAYYPRFRAWQGDRRLDVRAAASNPQVHGPADQLLVHAVDGEVVLRPDGPLPGGATGKLASVVGLLVLLGIALDARRFAEAPRAWLSQARVAQRLRAASDRVRSPRVLLAVIAAACVVVLLAAVLPRIPSRSMRLRAFGPDFASVRRDGRRCLQQPFTRRWSCPPLDEPSGEVLLGIATDPAPPPRAWTIGEPWRATRIVEKKGKATYQIDLGRVRLGTHVHARMAPAEGAVASAISLQVGDAAPIAIAYVHGWSTIAVPKGTAHATLVVTFDVAGALNVDLATDDVAANPGVATQ